ncbi:AraC-type DNA-binding protein [Brevibacterium aurantiacum]|uniref:AraC-type DNA-binding protein n=1 Tax=Brevibacterium aurantiacum TaxID=273384 RepID=A0A2H1JKC2_BREAU|nr:AraC family transcriptional regulator [Brevibacterium aurantiacum]SMX87794.1 AraC-type DNA-binding protein [Brevibacterium aurantiacum]
MRGPPDAFQALVARHRSFDRPVGPAAFDCVQVIVVRDGSAILKGEAGQEPVTVGDVLLLGPNILCGAEPEGHVTVTTIYLDLDYLLDQVFWQHSHILRDRLDAQDFAETLYAEAAQVLRVGEQRVGPLLPVLDELVALSLNGGLHRFHRMQSLWFAIVDQIAPFIYVTCTRQSPSQRAHIRPTHPRVRRFTPMRSEARTTLDRLRSDIAAPWTLDTLADAVHLSSKQLGRVFSETFGKTPLAYLTMLRVEKMAALLRESDQTVETIARRVGWQNRGRASEAFREYTGLTPSEYRTSYKWSIMPTADASAGPPSAS